MLGLFKVTSALGALKGGATKMVGWLSAYKGDYQELTKPLDTTAPDEGGANRPKSQPEPAPSDTPTDASQRGASTNAPPPGDSAPAAKSSGGALTPTEETTDDTSDRDEAQEG